MRNAVLTALATIIVPGLAVGVVPYLILIASGGVLRPSVGFIELGSVALAVLGAGMVVWVSLAFVTRGKGTPVPFQPPQEFVAQGLYTYVRNPMYIGALLVVFAEAAYFRSPWLVLYAAFLWLALHTFTIFLEEPDLETRFGETYRRYRERTPRWIPRRPRH
jgi:protein-S-isoprenylcysteine O-methyltransferase Ste14